MSYLEDLRDLLKSSKKDERERRKKNTIFALTNYYNKPGNVSISYDFIFNFYYFLYCPTVTII